MFIGLLGPSCAGKSFFLELLHKNNFSVPMSVTTRSERSAETWHIKQVTQEELGNLRQANRLSFITGAFGNIYACLDFSPETCGHDTAIIITEENVPEVKQKGGLVVQIVPKNLEKTTEKIRLLRKDGSRERVEKMLSYMARHENMAADHTFYNAYDEEDSQRFLQLMEELREK